MSKVCVVMSTYNGQKYLKAQLDSIFGQEDVELSVFVRDDGSSDKTIEILDRYRERGLEYVVDNNVGPKFSFLEAIKLAPEADYYSLADQDDVWDPNKLSAAVSALKKESRNIPLLYCSALRPVDKNLVELFPEKEHKDIHYSFLKGEILPAAGCTMVFNKRLKVLIDQYTPQIFPMHDYWILLVCLAVGGEVYYDKVPHISYRQHDANAMGGKRGLLRSIKRRIAFYKKMGRNFRTKMYKELLTTYRYVMPQRNIDYCELVINCNRSTRNMWRIMRNKTFWQGSRRWKIETALLLIMKAY